MHNVISLHAYRAATQDPADPPTLVSLAIDFSDIRRRYLTNEAGLPLLTLEDPVILGPRAHAQIRDMFWHYALRQIPSTWGELEGNWDYCRRLHHWLICMSPDADASTLKRLRTRHNGQSPGQGDLLWLLMTGDTDGAYGWHLENHTFERNALGLRRAPAKLRRGGTA